MPDLALPMPRSAMLGGVSSLDSDTSDQAIPRGAAPVALLEESPPEVVIPQDVEDNIRGLLDLPTKELRDTVEFDEKTQFFLGVRNDAPFDNFSVCAITFERYRALTDPLTKQRTIQQGRTVAMSPRLAAAIRKRAKEIYLQVEYGHDAKERPFIRRLNNRVDVRKNPGAKGQIAARPATFNPETNLKSTEWFPLERFLIIQNRNDLPVSEYDALSAERLALQDENARLRDENARLVNQMKNQ